MQYSSPKRLLLASALSLAAFGSINIRPANATIIKYSAVKDPDVGQNPRTGATSTQDNIIPFIGGDLPPDNSTSTSIDFSCWDLPNSPNASVVYQDNRAAGQTTPTRGQTISSLSLREKSLTDTYSHGLVTAQGNRPTANVTTNPNTRTTGLGALRSNDYITLREYRVRFGGSYTYNGPTELIYSNVVEGDTYTAIPNFSGYATPKYASNTIYRVFITLERKSDGNFWSGTAWTDRHVPIEASRTLVSGTTTGRVQWSKVGGWPTGTNLSSGDYIVRTMAVEYGQSGPGLLNYVTFTIAGPTPTPTPADTTPPQPATITSPADHAVVSSFSAFNGTCNDNSGGVGVGHLRVHLLLEGSPLLEWDWVNHSWSTGYNSIPNSYKDATIVGNTWKITTDLPTGANQRQGEYTVRLYATDKAGNGETYSAPAFTVSSGTARVASQSTPSPTPTPLPAPVKKPSFGIS